MCLPFVYVSEDFGLLRSSSRTRHIDIAETLHVLHAPRGSSCDDSSLTTVQMIDHSLPDHTYMAVPLKQ